MFVTIDLYLHNVPSILRFNFPLCLTSKASFPTTGRMLASWKKPTNDGDNAEITKSVASWPTLPMDTAGYKQSNQLLLIIIINEISSQTIDVPG